MFYSFSGGKGGMGVGGACARLVQGLLQKGIPAMGMSTLSLNRWLVLGNSPVGDGVKQNQRHTAFKVSDL